MVREGYMDPIYQMFDEREKEERRAQPVKRVKAETRARNTDEWLLVPAMAAWLISITFLVATF